MRKSNQQAKLVSDLNKRKQTSRDYLRNLTPEEKIAKLVDLQEQTYQMLVAREQNGGRPIPEKWRKWYKARYENGNIFESNATEAN